MREIKFRAWDELSHRMYHDVQFIKSGEGKEDWICFYEQGKQVTDHSNIIMNNPYFREQIKLMQFTGLHDCNGKEVFEGDCLGGSWGDGWIAYCDKCKSFEYFMKDFGCAACLGDIHWYEVVEADGDLEVIGNIWENPELLEAKECMQTICQVFEDGRKAGMLGVVDWVEEHGYCGYSDADWLAKLKEWGIEPVKMPKEGK